MTRAARRPGQGDARAAARLEPGNRDCREPQLLQCAAARPDLAGDCRGAEQARLSGTRTPVRMDRRPAWGEPADRAVLAVEFVLPGPDAGRPAFGNLRLLQPVLRRKADQCTT